MGTSWSAVDGVEVTSTEPRTSTMDSLDCAEHSARAATAAHADVVRPVGAGP